MTNKSCSWLILPFFLGLAACSSRSPVLHGSPYENPPEAADIPLEDIHGNEFSLERLRGKAILVFFGYTSCPDVCPPTLHNVAWIFDELGDDIEKVTFVFVSVDSRRDDHATLQNYLAAFDPRLVGLLGDEETTTEAARGYGVFFAREDGLEGELDLTSDIYFVAHTDRIFLIGPDGKLLTNYTFDIPRAEILEDLRSIVSDA